MIIVSSEELPYGSVHRYHEWPLPTPPSQKEAVVVELDPPTPHPCWRDLTIYLMEDILESILTTNRQTISSYPLRKYGGLSRSKRAPDNSHLHLLSDNKPDLSTHRRDKCVASLGESEVCVHRLRPAYFDDNRLIVLGEARAEGNLYCVLFQFELIKIFNNFKNNNVSL